ncbi:hypothetical protein [Methanobacterium sp. ACI-7]|uniref:hypothetical protein n=1 Tax=unclassified Methanobacterium TaxID=2627676 RepID=UPI0039C40DFB
MVKKNKGGRPSKLTPEIQKDIVNLIKAGNYVDITCVIVGINKSTYYDWMKRGKESRRPNRYRTFYEEVTKAHAICEARLVAIISKAEETYWKAAAWKLERRYPEKWGKPKTEKKNSFKINNGNQETFINFPVTTLETPKKEKNKKIESVKINKYEVTKNY